MKRSAIAIFATALVVRLIHLWQIRDAPFFIVLMGDARAYDEWARRLAAGDWIGTEVFYQAPLYPYFLGALYSLAGRDPLVVRACQAVLGSLACVALAYAGWRLFSTRAGIMAGAILALYAPAIFFDGLIQKSTLDVFFVCVMLAVVGRIQAKPKRRSSLGARSAPRDTANQSRALGDRGRARDWLWLGVVAGALSLTRENAIVIAGVILVWAFVQARTGRRRGAPYEMVAAATGLAIVLLPVAARNHAVGGGFYLTTSQFGPNFFIGNNARSDGTYMSLRPGRGAPEYERQDATEIAEAAVGRRLTPADVSSYWTGRAVDDIRAQPARWLRLLGRKAALLWNATEMLDTESQSAYEEWSWPLRVLAHVGHFGVLVPLAVFGLFVTWSDRRRLWVLHAMLVAYAASVVVFYVFARYRFPLVPFLVLFAAAGFTEAAETLRRRDSSSTSSLSASRRLRGSVLATVAAAVFCNWPLLSDARMRAISETNLGVALHEQTRFDDAEAHYRRAVAISPDYPAAHNNLGATRRAQGHLDEAIAEYEEALRLYPGYPSAQRNLANALHERGNARAARGDLDAAVVDLRKAAVLVSDDGGVRYDLGSTLLEQGKPAEAVEEFRAAIHLKPTAEAHNNLGIALGSLGRLDEAISQFEAALTLQSGFSDAQRNLEMALGVRRKGGR